MSWQQDTRCILKFEVLTLVAVASSGKSLWIWCRTPLCVVDPTVRQGLVLFASEGYEISPTWAKCHQLDFFDGRMFSWSSLVTVHLGKVMTADPVRNTVEWMPTFYVRCELHFDVLFVSGAKMQRVWQIQRFFRLQQFFTVAKTSVFFPKIISSFGSSS